MRVRRTRNTGHRIDQVMQYDTRKTRTVIGCLVCLGAVFISQLSVYAAEGGSSYYFPGAFASFGVAIPAAPGFQFVNQTLYYHGDADKAVLNGHVDLSLKPAMSSMWTSW